MTPTHKPEDGDRAPVSNGGAELEDMLSERVDAFGLACHLAGQHDGTNYMTVASRRELFAAIDKLRTDATALLAEKAQRIERLEAALRALMEGSRFEAGHWGSIRMPSDAAMELARAALSQPHPHGG